MKRLRIAWFSPLPDEKSSLTSAYVSALLLPDVLSECDVHLYTNSFKKLPDIPTYHYLKAFRNHKETPYDIFFYQLEDREALDFVRFHLGLMPGVVWFHDALLSNAGPVPLLNSPWADIVEKYNHPALPWPSRKKVHTYRGPLAYRELGYAAVPVFSSEVAHGEYVRNIESKVASRAGGISYFLPLPLAEECFSVPPAVHSEKLVCGIAGTPYVENRVEKVLRAMDVSHANVKLHWLVPERNKVEAENLLSQFEDLDVELSIGDTPDKWREVLGQVQVALHLSFTVFGHREPFPALSLAAGREVVATDFGVHDYLPDSLVWKICPGVSEVQELAGLFDRLSSISLTNSTRNRTFASERYNQKVIVQNLLSIFHESAQKVLPEHSKRWSALMNEAKLSLIEQCEGLVEDDYYHKSLEPIFNELGWSLS